MKEYTQQILDYFNIDVNLTVISKSKAKNSVTCYDLINTIISTNSLVEAATRLNRSDTTIARALVKIKKFNKPRTSCGWKDYFLNIINVSQCSSCSKVLPRTEFYSSPISTIKKIASKCRFCLANVSKANRLADPSKYKEYAKLHYLNNTLYYKCKAINRDKYLIQATPKWVEYKDILAKYSERGPGEDIDHIIPIKSPIVCGLHSPDNMRPLNSIENRIKSNKFEILTLSPEEFYRDYFKG